MIYRLIFRSKTTARIRYVEFNPENKTYSTDYYAANGGWNHAENVRLKDIRQVVERCEEQGYTKVTRCEE